MIPMGTIIRGDRKRFLSYSPEEHPISLQLGGDDPAQLSECTKIGEDYGYDEINLNVGCPSERVQTGNFGACLMASPNLVAKIVTEMKKSTQLPVTVKHRIGIDGRQSYEELKEFVQVQADAGCDGFIVHARIAILNGLSPKENRNRPPLRYDDVYRLKRDFPNLRIEINGGIKSIEETKEHLTKTDSVMIGRAAYENPYLFHRADSEIFDDSNSIIKTRKQIAIDMFPYIEKCMQENIPARRILTHLLGLFHGEVGNRKFKQYLTINMPRIKDGVKLLEESIKFIEDTKEM
jgi:tRNA-dihydrouridine synthase A